MPKVTVVLITKDEEENIGDALESASWADELVVLDSFSADRTVEICRGYTERVYQEAWRGFSAQKARAVELASNDWVFVLDADERITPGLAGEIKSLMEAGPDRAGYLCARRNHFMGHEIRHGGWYPDYSVRLFDRRRGSFRERSVHEAVDLAGEAGYLHHPMMHYTYEGISDYLARMERYSTLAAEEMAKAGREAGVAHMLFRPPVTFIRMYLLKLGFLDGMHGLVLAALYSYYTFAKYAKLWEMKEKRV